MAENQIKSLSALIQQKTNRDRHCRRDLTIVCEVNRRARGFVG
jgi:hypothetical protein